MKETEGWLVTRGRRLQLAIYHTQGQVSSLLRQETPQLLFLHFSLSLFMVPPFEVMSFIGLPKLAFLSFFFVFFFLHCESSYLYHGKNWDQYRWVMLPKCFINCIQVDFCHLRIKFSLVKSPTELNLCYINHPRRPKESSHMVKCVHTNDLFGSG